MRVLFAMDCMYYVRQGLLRGLERQGHEVLVLPLERYPKYAQGWWLAHTIRERRPDLMLTPGWSIGHFDLDQYHEALRKTGLFHVYWATEDPTFFDEVTMFQTPGHLAHRRLDDRHADPQRPVRLRRPGCGRPRHGPGVPREGARGPISARAAADREER